MTDEADMLDPLEALHRITLGDRPLDDVLSEITELAKRVVPGAADVSITLVDGDKAISAAYTGALAVDLDERQYEAGHGPCLEASRSGRELWIHNMATETRWPDYTPRAVDAGARSSVSIPLPVQEHFVGALNIYGAQPGAFDDAGIDLARTFAGYAAVALHNAQLLAASSALAQQMQDAMASRAVIEQAKGIIMGDRRVSADQAFGILKTLSQNSNRKLRDVAQVLVDSASSESPAPDS